MEVVNRVMAEALTKYYPEDGDPDEELSQDENKLRPEKRSDDEKLISLVEFF